MKKRNRTKVRGVAGTRKKKGLKAEPVDDAISLVRRLEAGDVLTHARCMGVLEEHVFVETEGPWLCGFPTDDTAALAGCSRNDFIRDIHPKSVTHVNRVPVEHFLSGEVPARPQAKQYRLDAESLQDIPF